MGKVKEKKILYIAAAVAAAAVAVIVLAVVLFRGGREETYRSIRIVELEGSVTIDRESVGSLEASVNMNLISGDHVTTSAGAYVVLRLDEDKYVMLGEQGAMKVEADGDASKGRTAIHLEAGSVLSEIQKPLGQNSTYEIVTPNATMSVRGTVFEARWNGTGSDGNIEVLVYEGKVEVCLEEQEPVLYIGGEYTQFTADETPRFLVERSAITEERMNSQMLKRLQQIEESGRRLDFGEVNLKELIGQEYSDSETLVADNSQAREPEENDNLSDSETQDPVTAEPSPDVAASSAPASTERPRSSAAPAPSVTPKPSEAPAPTATPEPSATPAPAETPKPPATPAPAETPELPSTPAPAETPELPSTPAPTETPNPSAPPTPAETPNPPAPPTPAKTPNPPAPPTPAQTPNPPADPTPAETPEPSADPTQPPASTEEPTPSDNPWIEDPTAAEAWKDAPNNANEPTVTEGVEKWKVIFYLPGIATLNPEGDYEIAALNYTSPEVCDDNRDNGDWVQLVADNSKITPPATTPTYNNIPGGASDKFVFDGWYTEQGDPWSFETDTVTSNIYLFPVWRNTDEDCKYYPVILRDTFGENYFCFSVKEGSYLLDRPLITAADPGYQGYASGASPTRAGYRLLAWGITNRGSENNNVLWGNRTETVQGVTSLMAVWGIEQWKDDSCQILFTTDTQENGYGDLVDYVYWNVTGTLTSPPEPKYGLSKNLKLPEEAQGKEVTDWVDDAGNSYKDIENYIDQWNNGETHIFHAVWGDTSDSSESTAPE